MAIAVILENPEPNLSRTKYLNNLTDIGDSSPSSKFLVKCCLGKGICSIEVLVRNLKLQMLMSTEYLPKLY